MDIDLLELSRNFDYMAVGREKCPTTGKEHYQGFAYKSGPQMWSWWQKRFPHNFFEFCRGSLQDNEKYCSKEGQYQEFGVKPMGNGKRRDLAEVCDAIITKKQKIEDIAVQHPTIFVQYRNGLRDLAAIVTEPYEHDTPRGVWIYGPPGAGKTHFARNNFKDIYVKSQNKWFDGYTGQTTIVLDDLDTATLGHYLKIWMDKWSCTGEIKGGTVHLRHHHFVVTSNFSIDELWPEGPFAAAIARRCRIKHLGCVYSSPPPPPTI